MTPPSDSPHWSAEDSDASDVPTLEAALAELTASDTGGTATLVDRVMSDVCRHLRDATDADRAAGVAAIDTLPSDEVERWLIQATRTATPDDLEAVADLADAIPALDISDDLCEAALALAESPERDAVFARLATSDAVRRHVHTLQRSDRLDNRIAGIELASCLGSTQAEAISRGLGDTAAGVRVAALELAVGHGDEFEADLARLAVSDQSADVRLLATELLASADHVTRLDVARRALVDADVAVRCAALDLLDDQGVDEIMLLADALSDESAAVVRAAAARLADSSPTDAPGILWRALVAHDAGHRSGLLAALDRLDPDALNVTLYRAVRSDDPAERALGLEVAARREHSEELVELLHEALTDPSVEVRMHALEALAVDVDIIDVERVGERVRDPAPAVRHEAIRLLRASNDDKTFEPLLTAAGDPVDHVRAQARAALLDRRGPALTAELLASLGEPLRRRTVRDLLVEIGSAALDPMLDVLDRAAEGTRAELGAVLRSAGLTDELVQRLAARDPEIRMRALVGLEAAADPASVGAIADCLADPVSSVRRVAVRTLGELDDPRAVEPLREALVSDPDLDLVPAIEEALRGLGADVPDDVVIELRSQHPVEP